MKFLTDQDVYAVTTGFLIHLGHGVVTAAQLGLAQADDADLLEVAQDEGRIFVTRDRDFVFGDQRLPGYARVFELAHIPLDNIILKQLRPYGVPPLPTRWARVDSYEEYMKIQRWERTAFPGSPPLAVEFTLWQNAGGPVLGDDDTP